VLHARVSARLFRETVIWIAAAMGTICFLLLVLAVPAHALEPISVSRDDTALDLTDAVESHRTTDGSLKISTAPDAEGIVRRVEVTATDSNGISHWAVLALANTGDEQIDRLLVAPHYWLPGSGILRPDLDAVRVHRITPSEGFSLDRQQDPQADVFRVTLDPGAIITLIMEKGDERLPQLYLWEPSAYKDTVNSYTLYQGIVLGIAGLLAVFLTILFVVKGSAMFPATAALAWGVLAYICVDFGFWNKVFTVDVASEPFWRAGTEIFLSASLIVFVYAYLSLARWNSRYSLAVIAWVLSLIIVMGVAVFQPDLAAGIARVSFVATVGLCALLILTLAIRGFDRAVMLVPTWVLLTAWTVGSGMAAAGAIDNDIVQPALVGGLVLIVLLLCFTVMQHAFAAGGFAQGLVSDAERSALALTGSGDILWDWNVARDHIACGEGIGEQLNRDKRDFTGPVDSWRTLLHPNDRDRFTATLAAVVDHKRGRIAQTFRMKADDGSFHWFRLRSRPMVDLGGQVVRCIGTLTDITEQKKSEERLLQDSVRDHLTGLENRELFVSRLDTLIGLSRQDKCSRPTVFHIDIDGFRKINEKYGFSAGDTILLTLARRLTRLLKSGDTIARLASDQFVIMLLSQSEPRAIATFADSIHEAISSPIDFGDEEFALSASVGLASCTNEHREGEHMMRDAELAKDEAKRLGVGHTEPFRPAFRMSKDETVVLLEDLPKAISNGQIELRYQPIVALEDQTIRGFEALTRWHHPKLGTLMPSDFVPVAERSGVIQALGAHVLERALKDLVAMPTPASGTQLFMSVNVSSRELLRSDLETDIKNALDKSGIPAERLHLEVTESMVMENPEHAAQILQRIRALDVHISLDDFGTGYSSLSYLMKFPFDTIKIDKSFVQARSQPERLVVLQAIVGLAHGLGQSLIAEGAEFESDVTDLIQLGCEYAQGYLFSEPMPLEEMIRFLGGETRLRA